MNKQTFFLSLTERIFIQKSANPSVCYCVARYENFVVNQKTSIFVSYVIEECANAFSCAYIELWVHLGSLESTEEARVALGYLLMQLLRIFCALQTSRVHPWFDIHKLSMNKFLILHKCILERKENPFNKLTKEQNKRKLISYRQSHLQTSSVRHNQLWKKYIKNKNSKLNRCDVIENTQRIVKNKDSTLLNSQNVILWLL